MENFIPTMMGGVERVHGTKFIEKIDDTDARIIPFHAQDNRRYVLVMTPGNIKMIPVQGNPTIDRAARSTSTVSTNTIGANTETVISFDDPIFDNGDLDKNWKGWKIEPEQFPSAHDGGLVGGWWEGGEVGAIRMVPRVYKAQNDPDTVTVTRSGTVSFPADRVTFIAHINFLQEVPVPSGYNLAVKITADGVSVFSEDYKDQRAGHTWTIEKVVNMPTLGWTGELELTVTLRAIPEPGEKYSTPTMRLLDAQIWAPNQVTVTTIDVSHDYTAEELPDIHFVQSPYDQKELVLTHPNHPPHSLYFDTDQAAYVCEPMEWTGSPPTQWQTDNYPRTCTSFMGRLILAGGQDDYKEGSAIVAMAETVWGTKVGDWHAWSDENDVNPDDSIEFTAIYRSPIQWIHGHKTLLVGALEMEYVASADGIFSPGDLGVALHSTNGGIDVQPAGMGDSVLFAADGGYRVRMATYDNQVQGWVADDLSILVPELFTSGVKRMVRTRNPHQMTLTLLGNGKVAVLHKEGPLAGWSDIVITNSRVVDLCVISNQDGVDVPYFVVERSVEGVDELHLEAIVDWSANSQWSHQWSYKVYNAQGDNILAGLEHLEGRQVQVVADTGYLGPFIVRNGAITLEYEDGRPINVLWAVVGMTMRSRLRTLPPSKADPGSPSRYTEFSVRTIGSTRPIINGERPADRTPRMAMNRSESLDIIADHSISTRGWDPYSTIVIEEEVPLRTEIVGIFGKLKTGEI